MRWDMFSCLHSLVKTITSAFNQAPLGADHQPALAALFTDRHFESYLILFTVCSVSESIFALTLLTPPFYSLTHCVCLSKTSQGALPVHSDELFCGNTLILNMTAHCYPCFGLLLNWSMLYWAFQQCTRVCQYTQSFLLQVRHFWPSVPQARNYIKSLPHMPKRNFADVFIGANPLGNPSSSLLKAHCLPLVVAWPSLLLSSCLPSCGPAGENAGAGHWQADHGI